MRVSITTDLRPLQRFADRMRKQMPFATSVAVNRTLRDSKDELAREMSKAFDRPAPWIFRGIDLKFSTKANLQGVITLGALGRASVLGHHVIPGSRPSKGMELALQAKGLLPSGQFVVPTSAAPRDAYGNVPRALIAQIMAGLQAGKNAGSARAGRVRRKLSKAGVQYFVGRPGNGLPAGIWEKRQFASGSGIRPLFLFVSRVAYRERLPFHEIVRKTVAARFAGHMARALEDAVRSAK